MTRRVTARVDDLTAAVRALEAHEDAVAQLARIRARATEAALQAGFDDLGAATAALLAEE